MKLRFMNGRCLDAPGELVRDQFPEMALWRAAYEQDEYVRLIFRTTSEFPGSPEIFPGILRALSALLQHGRLAVYSLDADRVVSVMTKPFEYTPDTWIIRVIPLAADLLDATEWHTLRVELLSIESELYHRQHSNPV